SLKAASMNCAGDAAFRNPIRDTAERWACAVSDHATAAPPSAASNSRRPMVTVIRPSRARCVKGTIARHERAVFTLACWNSCATIADAPNPPLLRASPLAHLRAYFRQHFLVCPFARRDRVLRIDTHIWPAGCVDTNPAPCTQRLAFAGK